MKLLKVEAYFMHEGNKYGQSVEIKDLTEETLEDATDICKHLLVMAMRTEKSL